MTHSREAITAARLILKTEQMLMSGAPSFDPIILLSISNRCWKKEQEITKHFRGKKTQLTGPHAGKNSLTVVVTMCTNGNVITSPMKPPLHLSVPHCRTVILFVLV